VSADAAALGAAAPPALLVRRPALLSREPIDPATAIGRLFAAGEVGRAPRGERAATAAGTLGPLAASLSLLPRRERERADLLAAWASALFATAHEGDRVERRIERLHRSAYLVARALAGARVASPFAARLGAESARRTLPRAALDALLAEARRSVREPHPSTPADWEVRTRTLAAAAAGALLGVPPTPAITDAAAGLLRLVRLLAVPRELAERRFHLPLAAPPRADPAAAEPFMKDAIADECEAVHQLLLRGARGVGEVPLTFRAALAGALALALRLLGHVEQNAGRMLVRPVRLGRVEVAWTLFRIRRQPLA
jgi:hypothetical protein